MPKKDLIVVADNNLSVRQGLIRSIQSAGWRAEGVSSAREFLAKSSFANIGCLITEVRLPDMTGPELRDKLTARKIAVPIVYVTALGDVPAYLAALKKGAVDFLVKPVNRAALLKDVRLALKRHGLQQRLERLTGRERQVQEYVVGGYLNREIALKLGIGLKTIKVHRQRVFTKMKAHSLPELVRMGLEIGIKPRLRPARKSRSPVAAYR